MTSLRPAIGPSSNSRQSAPGCALVSPNPISLIPVHWMPGHFDAIGIHDQDLGLSVLFSIHSNLACNARGVVVGIFNGRELFAILVDMNVFTVDNGKNK